MTICLNANRNILDLFRIEHKEISKWLNIFSPYIRTDSRYLFKIPDGYGEKYVGPLMCGGLTVAAPLYEYAGQKWDLKGKRVGIVGIGGLGHMAIQKLRDGTIRFRGVLKNDLI